MKIRDSWKIWAVAFIAAGLVGCEVAGEMVEDSQTIALGRAESAEVKLDIGVGELKIQGGASELMEAYFSYNIEHWKPEVDYRIVRDQGVLTVRQGESRGMTVGRKRNRWDISLNDDVPLDLNINFGVGEGKLDLTGLTLKSLDIDMGIGELVLDLSGDRKQGFDVILDGGIGSATIYLPEHIGVRARIDGGIGSIDAKGFKKRGEIYTNDAFGKADISIDIDVDAGIGSIELRLR
ncbi:MAG: toast rack family protein [Candidatus Aminicenantes bacterium]|nr:toast rack family protein [Candidatus Aminicenantes bacterium]MDH5467207.1 toast rack family protein [Candidatus Aminicenantes bacterium]MDH5704614.1 toast rack family protein [Candidatus Aminicenantes bacterium]